MEKSDEIVSGLSQKITSGGLITEQSLNQNTPLYLASAFTVDQAILRYYIRKVSELIQSISELGKIWKRRIKEEEIIRFGEKMG